MNEQQVDKALEVTINWLEALRESAITLKAEQVKHWAEMEALEEVLLDVWSKTSGIEVEKLKKVLEERKKYWHDMYLSATETKDKNVAGTLDKRTLSDFPDLD
jgi:hypothetical protein